MDTNNLSVCEAHMAMAICSSSSSKHSPTLPNISFSSFSFPNSNSINSSHLKTVSNYIQHSNPPLVLVYAHSSSSNYTFATTLVQEDDAFMLIPSETHDLEEMEHNWCSKVALRRRRRRRRRRTSSTTTLDCRKSFEDEKKLLLLDKNVGKSRFLTPKEEAMLCWHLKERARIEAVRTQVLAEIGGDELSSSQWAEAAGISQHSLDRILWNGKQSEERIVRCYSRLVFSVANSHQGRGLSLQDLTQEGSIGLLRGAIKFDPEKGYMLSTYAYWWIRQAISRAIAKKSRIIRLPGSINDLVPKIIEANVVLSRRLRRFPTYEEIAEAINGNAWAVRLAMERNRSPISLDQATMTSRGSMSLQGIIGGPEELTPEAMVNKQELKAEIEKVLECLCDREVEILRLHYGLTGGTTLSFEDIGRLLELSRERVRQINSCALSKLRAMDHLNYLLLLTLD